MIKRSRFDSQRGQSFLIWLWCAIHPSQVRCGTGLKIPEVHCVVAHLTCSLKIPICLFAKSSWFRRAWVWGAAWVLWLTLYSREDNSLRFQRQETWKNTVGSQLLELTLCWVGPGYCLIISMNIEWRSAKKRSPYSLTISCPEYSIYKEFDFLSTTL